MEPSIRAAGLRIRPFADGDVGAFVAAVRESVATVGRWMPWCHAAYSEAEARDWFDQCRRNLRARVAYDFGIFPDDDGTVFGGVSINQINGQHGIGNVGYWVRASCQRQGVATRAVRAVVPYGFHRLGLTRLEIVAAVDNLPSRGVAERAGAVFECIARNRLMVHGRPVPAAVHSLVPGDLD